jgi:hypothetical protein
MRNRAAGTTPVPLIQRELGLGDHQIKKLREVLKDSTHPTTQALRELGAYYEVQGVGRGAKSYIVKR